MATALIAAVLVPALVATTLMAATLVTPALVTPALASAVLLTAILMAIALMAVVLPIALDRFAVAIVIGAIALGPGIARLTMSGIERRREALIAVLDIDFGDGNVAPADPRPLTFLHRSDHSIVMVGMLEEILRGDPVTRRAGVARQLQVFLQDLIGVASDADLGGIAVIALALVGHAGMRPAMRLTRTTTAAAPIVVIVVWSHATVTSDC